jgi:hypothetical protein
LYLENCRLHSSNPVTLAWSVLDSPCKMPIPQVKSWLKYVLEMSSLR